MANMLSTVLKTTKVKNTTQDSLEYNPEEYCTVERAAQITGLSIPRIRQISQEGGFGTLKYGVKRVYMDTSKVKHYQRRNIAKNSGKEALEYNRTVKRVLEATAVILDLLKNKLDLPKAEVDATVKTITTLHTLALETAKELGIKVD